MKDEFFKIRGEEHFLLNKKKDFPRIIISSDNGEICDIELGLGMIDLHFDVEEFENVMNLFNNVYMKYGGK
jgi:hypothetical protein